MNNLVKEKINIKDLIYEISTSKIANQLLFTYFNDKIKM